MKREMNRKDRALSLEETKDVLMKGEHGTLSMNGDEGFPYGIPVNYVYVGDAIYVHSSLQGYKIDALKRNDKVCFSVIASAEVLPSKFTAKYESVVITGIAEFVEEEKERERILVAFIERYSFGYEESGMKFVKAMLSKTAIIKINIGEMTGKANRGKADV